MRTIERTSQLTTCGETHAAQFSRRGLGRRSIPAEPRRYAALCVAFRSKYTRASSPGGGSSLTRLVSRAPPRPRRSPGFHHRLLERDYKRECRGRHRASPDASVAPLVKALANDQPPEPRCHDHALSGEWADHRDYHVRPDLVLMYREPDAATLRLVHLGSHSELGF